jgi:hypothetical protein
MRYRYLNFAHGTLTTETRICHLQAVFWIEFILRIRIQHFRLITNPDPDPGTL